VRRIRKPSGGRFPHEYIVRLSPHGTVIKTRLDRKATVHRHLANLDARGLKRPEFIIIDGAHGLDATFVALWGEDLVVQRCMVQNHRNLPGHAPKPMHDDFRDMICADTAVKVEKRRKAFLRKWRQKCKAVADSLKEAGTRPFIFARLDPPQWRSARTTNAIERLN